jgi:hypothetical protein
MRSPDRFLILLLLLFPFSGKSFVSNDSLFEVHRERAIALYDSLKNGSDDAARDSIGKLFKSSVRNLLDQQGVFGAELPELSERIAILYAPDSSCCLFNWNVAHTDGTHDYSAFFLRRNEDGRSELHEPEKLLSASDRNKKTGGSMRKEELERMDLEAGEWIPALYYRIIRKERNGEPFYTLLGWEGKDRLTTRKTIEVLRFERDGTPHFGLPVFKKEEEGNERETWRERDRERRRRARREGRKRGPAPKERIVFEYTDDAVMTLQYEKEKDRIVFNQLVPERPDLEGMYEFYAPDLLFNAYEWKESGHWQFKKKVKPENERQGARNWNDPEE